MLNNKNIRYSLEKYRSKVIFLVLGLMIGSLYAIFMGPTTLEVPQNARLLKVLI